MKRHTILVELKIDSSDNSDRVNEQVEELLGSEGRVRAALNSAGLDIAGTRSLIAARAS